MELRRKRPRESIPWKFKEEDLSLPSVAQPKSKRPKVELNEARRKIKVEEGGKPKVEEDVKPKVELDVKPKVEPDIKPKLEADVKPKIEEDVKPKVEGDIKPKVEVDTKPRVEDDMGVDQVYATDNEEIGMADSPPIKFEPDQDEQDEPQTRSSKRRKRARDLSVDEGVTATSFRFHRSQTATSATPGPRVDVKQEDTLVNLMDKDEIQEIIDENRTQSIAAMEDVKVKQEEYDLGLGEGNGRPWPPAFPVNLPADIMNVTCSRDFLSHAVGGGPQDTFPHPSRENAERTGIQDLMCINALFNPNAPRRPGKTGQFCTCELDSNLNKHFTTFSKLAENIWWYVGDHDLESTTPLSPAEFNKLDDKVKMTWGKSICKFAWGTSVKSRVAFRKEHGGEPSQQDVKDFIETEEGKKALSDVTADDVKGAFEVGEETIYVWTMRCTGYNEELQRFIAKWGPPWDKAHKKLKFAATSSRKTSATTGSKKTSSRKNAAKGAKKTSTKKGAAKGVKKTLTRKGAVGKQTEKRKGRKAD